jgi:hypothetical protein
MQRAASSPTGPKTPNSPDTPTTSDARPSKRQRLSNGAPRSRYSLQEVDAMQAAVAEEEEKRNLAMERHAAIMGETRWVLSVRKQIEPKDSDLIVGTIGHAEIDQTSEDEDDSDRERPQGRMTFGKVVYSGKKAIPF